MEPSDAQQAVSIAQAILDGSLPLLLGCKRILAPLERLKVRMDPEFRIFVGIDSETDHLPLDSEFRKLWLPEALIEKDKEIAKATEWAEKTKVRAACEKVIERFGEAG